MKSKLPDELLARLGLTADDVADVDTMERPADHVGRGLSTQTPGDLGAVKANPLFSRFRLDDLQLGRWDFDPSVVAVEASASAVHQTEGASDVIGDDLVVLDGRGGPAAIVFEAHGELRALFVIDAKVHLAKLSSSLLDRLRVPRHAEPLPEAPDVAALTDDKPTAAWLRDAAQSLAQSPRWLDRVAAVGLLSRAWAPTDAESRRALAAGTLVLPRDRAEAWLGSLPEAVRFDLQRASLLAADDWERLFEATLEAMLVDPVGEAASVVSLLHRRDDLESLAWTLEQISGAKVLRDRLDELDDEAAARRSELHAAFDALHEDPRLEALGWIAPELWWAQWN